MDTNEHEGRWDQGCAADLGETRVEHSVERAARIAELQAAWPKEWEEYKAVAAAIAREVLDFSEEAIASIPWETWREEYFEGGEALKPWEAWVEEARE